MPRIEILIDGRTAFEKDDFDRVHLEMGRDKATLEVAYAPSVDLQSVIDGITGTPLTGLSGLLGQ